MHVCNDDDILLTPTATAAFLQVTVGTLAVWRSTKRYDLPYVKVGRRIVRYRLSDVKRFLEEWKPLQWTDSSRGSAQYHRDSSSPI